jgi:DNA-directed RNA polymerase subunit F
MKMLQEQEQEQDQEQQQESSYYFTPKMIQDMVSHIDDEKIQNFILEIFNNKIDEIDSLYELYTHKRGNRIYPRWLELVELGNFVKEENPDKVYIPGRNREGDIERGISWTIIRGKPFSLSEKGVVYLFFVSSFGNLVKIAIESLKESLDSIDDHFKVDAFIKILNIMEQRKKINEQFYEYIL